MAYSIGDGVHSLYELGKTASPEQDAEIARLLDDAFDKLLENYQPFELSDKDSYLKRMHRQNQNFGGGNETSVWTSYLVNIEGGKITEVILSELYPSGLAGIQFWTASGAPPSGEIMASALLNIGLREIRKDAQGTPTGYEGVLWQDVPVKAMIMEVVKGSRAEAGAIIGAQRAPFEHGQHSMTTLNDVRPIELLVLNAVNGFDVPLLELLEEHVKNSFETNVGEISPAVENIPAYLEANPAYQNEMSEIRMAKAQLRLGEIWLTPERPEGKQPSATDAAARNG